MNPKSRLLFPVAVALVVISVGVTASVLFVAGVRPGVASSGTAQIGGPFTLVATDGATVSDRTYRSKWQIIFFGYTSCPDACPVALSKLSIALEKLGPDADKVHAIFITIDLQRDTREILAEYLKSFDSRIVGLTGSQSQIDQAIKEYRVSAAPRKTGGADYLIDHSTFFYLMDPQGTFRNVLDPSLSGEEIADRLRKEIGNPKS
jgi:protein SCO1/2